MLSLWYNTSCVVENNCKERSIFVVSSNRFVQLGLEDYELFLKYYTQIEYSYFPKKDLTPEKERFNKLANQMAKEITPRDVPKNFYEKMLQQGDFYLYYAENDAVLGLIAITENLRKRKVEIQEFFILTKYQGQHLGKQMYQDLLRFLKEKGYLKVRLELMCALGGAEEFWKRQGFVLCKRDFGVGAERRFYNKWERLNEPLSD